MSSCLPTARAEILQADLAGLALQLARWGVAPEELAWLDAPPAAAYAQPASCSGGWGRCTPAAR